MGDIPLFTGNACKAKIAVPFKTASVRNSNNLAAAGASPTGFGNNMATYKRRDVASIRVEEDVCCMMGNWILEGSLEDPDVPLYENEQKRIRGLSVAQFS